MGAGGLLKHNAKNRTPRRIFLSVYCLKNKVWHCFAANYKTQPIVQTDLTWSTPGSDNSYFKNQSINGGMAAVQRSPTSNRSKNYREVDSLVSHECEHLPFHSKKLFLNFASALWWVKSILWLMTVLTRRHSGTWQFASFPALRCPPSRSPRIPLKHVHSMACRKQCHCGTESWPGVRCCC